MKGKLYLCATPIGNLSDISVRTLEVLRSVDLIAAEDTRHTLKLLNHFDIQKPMTSYFEHNRREKGEHLIGKMEEGLSIALVSDAGTPAISDPGEDLVALCHEHDIAVVPVPGACAAVCALAASGLPTGRFCFEGFLTTNRRSRKERLQELTEERRTMIFYEAPHKLLTTLKDLYEAFGDRRMSVARELTKMHEQIFQTTVGQALCYFQETPPKGEFVLILEGCEPKEMTFVQSPQEYLQSLIQEGMDKKTAIKKVATERNLPKREVYAFTIEEE